MTCFITIEFHNIMLQCLKQGLSASTVPKLRLLLCFIPRGSV